MYSVGHQLMQARQARQLSIEDVAFETRIPHSSLRDMENDDLSNFANLTYAKGFLKLYSRYLNLDLSDYLDEFDTSAIADVTGHEYVHTASAVRLLSAPAIAVDDSSRPRGSSALGIAALTALLLGGGWFYYKSQATTDARAGSPGAPAKSVAAASAPSAGSNPASANVNTLAKAELGTLQQAPPREAAPAPKATIVPEDIVRKATPVDDDGNEIPAVRPERL